MRPTIRIAAAVGLLVLSGAACGGSSGKGSHPDSLGEAFQAKATAVCETALSQKKAQGPFPYPDFNPTQPDLSKLPSIARLETTTVKIYQQWRRDLLMLGDPPTGRTAWNHFLAALSDSLQAIVDQQDAGERVDGPRFTEDYYAGNKYQHELERAADGAGLPACARTAAA
jgi:hypothetical protein